MAEPSEEKEIFALMMMDDADFEVTISLPFNIPRTPNEPITNSYNTMGELGHRIRGVGVGSGSRTESLPTCNSDLKIESDVPTLINSGASDYCFVNKDSFITLTSLHKPTIGLAAGKESVFNIIEKKKAKIQTVVNYTKRNITFKNALHTPDLRSNLISVSKLAEKGIRVEFDKLKTRIKSKDSIVIMKAKWHSCLYAVETLPDTPTALVIQTKQCTVPFDI